MVEVYVSIRANCTSVNDTLQLTTLRTSLRELLQLNTLQNLLLIKLAIPTDVQWLLYPQGHARFNVRGDHETALLFTIDKVTSGSSLEGKAFLRSHKL